jgi:hypothetical protein
VPFGLKHKGELARILTCNPLELLIKFQRSWRKSPYHSSGPCTGHVSAGLVSSAIQLGD